MKSFAIGAALALGTITAGAVQASPVGTILGQHSNGKVYSIFTDGVTATASLFKNLNNFDEQGNAANSPNALGYNGALDLTVRSTFGAQANTIYVDDTPVAGAGATPPTAVPPPDGLGGAAIAAGDVVGSTYYYATGDKRFGSISNIFGPNPIINPTVSFPISAGGSVNYGDLAIKGDNMFVSYRTPDQTVFFQQYSLSAVLAGTAAAPIPTSTTAPLFAGLAFSGHNLFGIVAGIGNSVLWSIGTGVNFGTFTEIGTIAGLPNLGQLTDAAPIPLPMGVWLMITGVAGAVALRRRKMAQAA